MWFSCDVKKVIITALNSYFRGSGRLDGKCKLQTIHVQDVYSAIVAIKECVR
jgi:hypothetical protein